MNIDEMEAGREMDALVAKAMGCDMVRINWGWGDEPFLFICGCDDCAHENLGSEIKRLLKEYSTNDAAALEITETWEYNWNICRDVGKSGSFETRGDRDYRVILSYPGMDMAGTVAPTLALAISRTELKRAALKAVTE